MIIDVTTKYEDGSVAFDGKLNREEVSFVLNVGINYLMANGALPLFTGKEEEELHIHASPENTQ